MASKPSARVLENKWFPERSKFSSCNGKVGPANSTETMSESRKKNSLDLSENFLKQLLYCTMSQEQYRSLQCWQCCQHKQYNSLEQSRFGWSIDYKCLKQVLNFDKCKHNLFFRLGTYLLKNSLVIQIVRQVNKFKSLKPYLCVLFLRRSPYIAFGSFFCLWQVSFAFGKFLLPLASSFVLLFFCFLPSAVSFAFGKFLCFFAFGKFLCFFAFGSFYVSFAFGSFYCS